MKGYEGDLALFTRLDHADRPGHRPWCSEVVIGPLLGWASVAPGRLWAI